MDKTIEEKLKNFEKLWQRISAPGDLPGIRSPVPFKLMPKKEKKSGLRRYTPYSP